MRVLYIEDEPADAQLVERYTRRAQHELILVDNLEDAWTFLEGSLDLILVDVLLQKDRAGYRFAQAVRAHGYSQPIIAVTGLALPEEIQRCYEVGFTDVLTKPYAINQLVDLFTKYGE
jgi:CheY-like chemotaxis protein